MTSLEFAEWIAFYRIADGGNEDREPSPDELGAKIAAWAAAQNARVT